MRLMRTGKAGANERPPNPQSRKKRIVFIWFFGVTRGAT